MLLAIFLLHLNFTMKKQQNLAKLLLKVFRRHSREFLAVFIGVIWTFAAIKNRIVHHDFEKYGELVDARILFLEHKSTNRSGKAQMTYQVEYTILSDPLQTKHIGHFTESDVKYDNITKKHPESHGELRLLYCPQHPEQLRSPQSYVNFFGSLISIAYGLTLIAAGLGAAFWRRRKMLIEN